MAPSCHYQFGVNCILHCQYQQSGTSCSFNSDWELNLAIFVGCIIKCIVWEQQYFTWFLRAVGSVHNAVRTLSSIGRKVWLVAKTMLLKVPCLEASALSVLCVLRAGSAYFLLCTQHVWSASGRTCIYSLGTGGLGRQAGLSQYVVNTRLLCLPPPGLLVTVVMVALLPQGCPAVRSAQCSWLAWLVSGQAALFVLVCSVYQSGGVSVEAGPGRPAHIPTSVSICIGI